MRKKQVKQKCPRCKGVGMLTRWHGLWFRQTPCPQCNGKKFVGRTVE